MFALMFKDLERRKARTLLTMVGIAVGVAMIVALGAIGDQPVTVTGLDSSSPPRLLWLTTSSPEAA